MRMVNGRELRRRVQLEGVQSTVRHLRRALVEGHLEPTDFSIRDLATALIVSDDGKPVGRSWVESLGPQKSGGLMLMEAAAGVSLSGFSNITGQIFYNRVMEGYTQEAFVASSLVDSYQTDLNGEKIPGITGLVEDVQEVHEGMPFPEIGFSEDYIETPATTKRGFIISVNKETIFFDRTGMVLRRAGEVGEVLARKKEKLLWDMIFGFTNTFKWRGTTYNTYQTAAPWINKMTGVSLTDWTTIDAVEQLEANMLEPNTGEPIVMNTDTIVHMPAKRHQFRQITRATTLETLTQTSTERRFGPNTLDAYTLVESKFAYQRLLANGISAANAKEYWLKGDFKGAFAWAYNWPVTVVQAPDNSEAEFKQDIVLRWKASERGAPVTMEPRKAFLVYNN